jgi:hypothetical protein
VSLFLLGFWMLPAQADSRVEPEFALSAPSGFQLGAEQAGDHWLNRWVKTEKARPYLQAGWFSWGVGGADADTGTTLTVTGAELGARWYAYRNFYIGSGLGYRLIQVGLTFSGFSLGEGAQIDRGNLAFHTIHVPMHLGWTWLQGRTFTLASDLGVQIPVVGWADVKVQGSISNSEVNASPLNRIARFMLPSVTFLRATWHMGGVGRDIASEESNSTDEAGEH